MAAVKRSDWVFPSPRGDGRLSHIVLQKVMAKLGVDFTVHGFRSSLRDWAGDETSFPEKCARACWRMLWAGSKARTADRTH